MTLADRIDELVRQHGSLRAVARVTEMDAGYLSRLRSGEKASPEKDKLRRLGLRRVVSYELLKTAVDAKKFEGAHFGCEDDCAPD
jgi:transcriptional regulator with XRE-family HTH domain